MQHPQIHVLTDTYIQQRFSHLELTRMALDGGADVVQYRHKGYQPLVDAPELQAIAQLPKLPHQRWIINDDPNLAQTIGADGVHIGTTDAPPLLAREILGPQALIGATVHSLNELYALKGQPINYIGVGPVFGTQSKATGLPPLGLARLAEICQQSTWPVIAIGSINRQNAREVIAAGASGIAVLSDICCAENPQKAVAEFRAILH
jgi:thiamine-phosphate pyrophosphorylase